jgi:hypothetical protein
MSREEYTINAYSPSLNQSMREINLEMGNPQILDKNYANQVATAFAYKLNQKAHMQATDWVGQAKFETVGIETLPNYLFHTGT